MTLVDSHCHLDFPGLIEAEEDVLARAAAAGVGTMLTIGTRLSSFPNVLAIARRHDNVFCTVGVHPHEAGEEAPEDTGILLDWAADPKVVGFGESGLDFFYDHSPRDAQRANFRLHIAASRETGLPLVIHTRDADDETVAILAEESGKGAFPFLIHCFSGGPELAAAALALGGYVSVSGIVTFNKSTQLRDTLAKVPLDRLLIETDAPYLAPVPHRGKQNEPAYVARTAERLAEVKDVSPAALAEATTDNFFRLFSKAKR